LLTSLQSLSFNTRVAYTFYHKQTYIINLQQQNMIMTIKLLINKGHT